MRLSVFSAENSQQLLTDLRKIYEGSLTEAELADEALTAMIEDQQAQLFITLFNQRHLGAVQVFSKKGSARLHKLCVRDITRRRGVGNNLLREVENNLKRQGLVNVQLNISDYPDKEHYVISKFLQQAGYNAKGQVFSKTL